MGDAVEQWWEELYHDLRLHLRAFNDLTFQIEKCGFEVILDLVVVLLKTGLGSAASNCERDPN